MIFMCSEYFFKMLMFSSHFCLQFTETSLTLAEVFVFIK